MNALPEDRRAIHGRTFGQSWSARHFDPIERYTASPWTLKGFLRAAICVAGSAVIGALLAQAF